MLSNTLDLSIFNVAELKGKTVIATDAKEYHYFMVNRILHKVGL